MRLLIMRGGSRFDKDGNLLTGRKKGSFAKRRRKKDTITLFQEDWDKLDEIGPSRGKAVEKLLREFTS
jgi:hypothetical protein